MFTLRRNSIRARLILGAALVLFLFLLLVGWALEQAFASSALSAHYERLQARVYLLMAVAELDPEGSLVMPPSFDEPRLSLPGSGLYAKISNPGQHEIWQSASTLGLNPPFVQGIKAGSWHYGQTISGGKGWIVAATGVQWAQGPKAQPLTFSVAEDDRAFRKEIGQFRRSLWVWLGGASLVLLLGQTLLLGWGLDPLRRVAFEIGAIESGKQERVLGRYPTELAALTNNLNTLIEQERKRQTRYKDALADLAHSLKTPLAVLHSALNQSDNLAAVVSAQVARMDGIVQHQLGRARASGAARFVPPLLLAPVVQRITDTLQKIYAGRALQFILNCPPELCWRLDEGDAFEVLGNTLDNAAKWAQQQVKISIKQHDEALLITIEDDGPGFVDPEAALQRGVRLDEQVPGHGIGLTVVADIIAAHAGQLTLDRSPLGGARISMTLPQA